MDPLELYVKIQELVQNEARKVATDVYNELGTKFNVAEVPAHTHTGVDTNRVNQKDVIPGSKYTTSLSEDTTETVTLGGVFNPSRISFNGFVANNADGSPATKRAIIQGAIEFGPSFEFSDLVPPITVSTSGSGKSYVQYCNGMFVDSTTLANNRVFSTEGAGNSATAFFIYAIDNTGGVIASAQLTKYNNQTGILTIDFVVGTNYKIQGAFTIT